ncbi:MAG: hypothetical protein VZQ61_06335 [Christensenellaceae bacterium]
MAGFSIERKKLFKIVSAEILVCVISAALIGIGLLFGLFKGTDVIGQIMLTLLTLFIAGLFLLNSINAVTAGNKVGIAAAIMLVVSALLCIILIWAGDLLGDFYDTYARITVIVAMVSILLDLIVGNYIILGKSLLVVQIFQYLSFAYVELVIAFLILGSEALINVWQIFVLAIIIALTLYIVLKVKEKNIAQKETETKVNANGEEMVTITKKEYEELKAAAEKLKELTENAE